MKGNNGRALVFQVKLHGDGGGENTSENWIIILKTCRVGMYELFGYFWTIKY